MKDQFLDCEAEEGCVAVAALTDDNAADGNLDRRKVLLIRVSHTGCEKSVYQGVRKMFCTPAS